MGASLCLAVRKKKKIAKETIALPEIPEEVLIEILIRLPAKSLMRYKCVSKLWLSLIISPYFTNLFLKSSPRRRLFAYITDARHRIGKYALLISSSSSSHDQSVVSVIDQNLTMRIIGGHFVNAVRGLACFRAGRRVQICNLHTRQLVELPTIRSQVKGNNVWNYFGHDPVHDVYKVLTLVWEFNKEPRVRLEHHVLVLGAGAIWKNTQCHIPHHSPYTRGISINGVLYYGARTYDNRFMLMSFDLSSEEFNLIEFPNVSGFGSFSWMDLMNYKGRVAFYSNFKLLWRHSASPRMEVWVLEDADKSQWSVAKTIFLPVSQMDFTLQGYQLRTDGTSRTGQLYYLKNGDLTPNQPVRFFGYDVERNEITRRIELKLSLLGFKKTKYWLWATFWDDVENIMYLET
ncbi:PREDICTED: putative F-box protein At3g52320 [Camelina sativa]|uniref:F-box protein At3g52320 n=1 Tax=Camelina sativa TaxID=90675 RepID=A0ABM0TTS1_CAMSA|nr:PREDICTED: putative F-box protein At3g52320 [Camelina sativa]